MSSQLQDLADKAKRSHEAQMKSVHDLRAFVEETEGRELSAEDKQKEERLLTAVAESRTATDRFLTAMQEMAAASDSDVALRSAMDSVGEERNEFRSWVMDRNSAPLFESRVVSKLTGSGAAVKPNMADALQIAFRETSTAIKAGARVIQTTSGETIQVPMMSAWATVQQTAEGGIITASDPTLALKAIPTYKYTHLTQITNELLKDKMYDVEGELGREAGESIGSLIGGLFITGTGTAQPEGVLATGVVTQTRTAGSATAIAADDLRGLMFAVPTLARVNGAFVMNDATLAKVAMLKDNTGQYLWQPSNILGQPDTLFGKKVYTDPAVPVQAAAAKCAIFGDFSRGYTVRMAGTLEVARSVDFLFSSDMVALRLIQRCGGAVTNPSALAVLVCP